MKKFFLILIISILALNFNCTNAVELTPETNAISKKEIRAQVNKIKTKRIIIANALLLDSAQRKKADEIYYSVIDKEAIILEQLQKEQEILKSMTKKTNTFAERKAQRKKVYELQHALRTIENNVDKEFKKMLNHNQRVKFNRLKKEINISDY
ncbi:hypothetical protein IKE67_07675 [bacterium]|nr:hypothetical protein [bacterium]